MMSVTVAQSKTWPTCWPAARCPPHAHPKNCTKQKTSCGSGQILGVKNMTQLCTLCMVSLLLYLYDKRHDYIYSLWQSLLIEPIGYMI